MTGSALLFDLNQERVAVAIEGDVFHVLRVAAGFALHPIFLARAAPEVGLAGFDGVFERGAVHPGHHEDAAVGVVLNNRGDEAFGVEFQFVVEAHRKLFWCHFDPRFFVRC